MKCKSLVVGTFLAAMGLGMQPAFANLVTNGDFSGGNTGFTSSYTYTAFINSETQYTIVPAASINTINAYGDWTAVSTDPLGGNGNVLAANGATSPNTVVWQEIVTVTPNTNYSFSFYGVDVNAAKVSNATLQPEVNGITGALLYTSQAWQQNSSFIWNSGASTSATLTLTDVNTSATFNDFALDYIGFNAVGAPGPGPGTGLLSLAFLILAGSMTRARGFLAR